VRQSTRTVAGLCLYLSTRVCFLYDFCLFHCLLHFPSCGRVPFLPWFSVLFAGRPIDLVFSLLFSCRTAGWAGSSWICSPTRPARFSLLDSRALLSWFCAAGVRINPSLRATFWRQGSVPRRWCVLYGAEARSFISLQCLPSVFDWLPEAFGVPAQARVFATRHHFRFKILPIFFTPGARAVCLAF
jgi:hypothetical protein